MEFAINYSRPAARLLQAGRIRVDRLKCPAWPDLLAEARRLHPCYVHLPLVVGSGLGDALDSETGRPADWPHMERLLAETGTNLVNVHLYPAWRYFSDIPVDSLAPAHVDRVAEAMLRDLQAVVARCGPERVIAENVPATAGGSKSPAATMQAGILPEVVRRVIEEAGCGLLLDLSHARLAAASLALDPEAYLAGLPLTRTREIHVTGIQIFSGRWLDLLRQAGLAEAELPVYAGHPVDHLPLLDADWQFLEWAVAHVHAGHWGQPQVLSFEYGGVGRRMEPLTLEDEIAVQVPRLYSLVHGGDLRSPS